MLGMVGFEGSLPPDNIVIAENVCFILLLRNGLALFPEPLVMGLLNILGALA